MYADEAQPTAIRLDVWLDIAGLFKIRSEAQKACKSGQTAKSNRLIRPGDELEATGASPWT
jgi:ribosomal 50S subunit-recycling heat shock protein